MMDTNNPTMTPPASRSPSIDGAPITWVQARVASRIDKPLQFRVSESVQYSCEIRLHDAIEGGYSVYVPELPGVVSDGDTLKEALDNIAEALRGALQAYLQDGGSIPWQKDIEPLTKEETRLGIIVNV